MQNVDVNSKHLDSIQGLLDHSQQKYIQSAGGITLFWQKLRKVDDNYILTIPKEEVERLNLQEGQLLAIELQPAKTPPLLSSDLQNAFEESWDRNGQGYRYLADH